MQGNIDPLAKYLHKDFPRRSELPEKPKDMTQVMIQGWKFHRTL